MTHKTYPKIVGETGGKDFVMVHKSANPNWPWLIIPDDN
jgi:1-pyrroline-5-carboxylate dehydrogenase